MVEELLGRETMAYNRLLKSDQEDIWNKVKRVKKAAKANDALAAAAPSAAHSQAPSAVPRSTPTVSQAPAVASSATASTESSAEASQGTASAH